MSTNSAPGFKKYPEHSITTRPADARVTVTFRGELIADTRDAVQMQEAMGRGKSTVAPVVYYIPRKDVKMERLVRSSHHSYCPFKGEASYFSLKEGPENAKACLERFFVVQRRPDLPVYMRVSTPVFRFGNIFDPFQQCSYRSLILPLQT